MVTIKVHGHNNASGGSNNGEAAIAKLRRALQRELVFRRMKAKRFYIPKWLDKLQKKEESERRRRKMERKRRLED